MEDERKVFDRIPEQFDRMRWQYTPEMFAALADGYAEYIGTHADHIGLVEPHRSAFFGGIRDTIEQHGGKLVMNLTDYLRLTRKP